MEKVKRPLAGFTGTVSYEYVWQKKKYNPFQFTTPLIGPAEIISFVVWVSLAVLTVNFLNRIT